MSVKNVLFPGVKMPATLVLARALHEHGVRVDACDSFADAPGLHSRYVAESHVVPAAARETAAFASEIAHLSRAREIDLIFPIFEDVFFVRRWDSLIDPEIMAPDFETLHTLHDKSRFQRLAADLGLPTPKTLIATSNADLRAAIGELDEYVARPAFSRGGMKYLTNVGPRAGEQSVDDAEPSEDNPWLVQEFVEGTNAAIWSIATEGELRTYVSYIPAIEGKGGFAIRSESVEDFGALEMTRTIAKHIGMNGSIGLDVRLSPKGPVLVECNPRTTSGTLITPRDWLAEAILGTGDSATRIVPPGQRTQIDMAYLDAQLRPKASLPATLRALVSAPDPDFSVHDVMPGVYFFLSYHHESQMASKAHMDFVDYMLRDIAWDGQPIVGPEHEGATA